MIAIELSLNEVKFEIITRSLIDNKSKTQRFPCQALYEVCEIMKKNGLFGNHPLESR